MDLFQSPDKPIAGGLLQKITGYQTTKKTQPPTVYLSPSSVHFPCLDSQGNRAATMLDESAWDKQLHNVRDYPKLQVVQKDGGWFALNCAQLQLFQKWEREGKCSKVKVDIVSIHHVPPMLRKLMIIGAGSSDRKLFKRDISDKTNNASNGGECQIHSVLQEVNRVSLANNDSAHVSVRNCGSNQTALHEPNHVTIKYSHINKSHDIELDHVTELGAYPTAMGLKSSKSDPYGTVLKDCEENEVEFKNVVKGDMLYKTLSSFQLDKESGALEFGGVQTARGYHKVHQADPNEDTDDDTDGESSDDSSDVDDEVSEGDDDVGDDVTSDGTEDSGSVYSNDVGSELGWTDEDDEDDEDNDDCDDTDQFSDDSGSGSEAGSNTEKLDENESLL